MTSAYIVMAVGHEGTSSTSTSCFGFLIRPDWPSIRHSRPSCESSQVDEDHDRRMDLKVGAGPRVHVGSQKQRNAELQEFQWCMSMCGLKMSQAKAEAGRFSVRQNWEKQESTRFSILERQNSRRSMLMVVGLFSSTSHLAASKAKLGKIKSPFVSICALLFEVLQIFHRSTMPRGNAGTAAIPSFRLSIK